MKPELLQEWVQLKCQEAKVLDQEEYDHVASMYLYCIFCTHALLAVCTIYVIAAELGGSSLGLLKIDCTM